MKPEDTHITTAGVFRCCIATVAMEYKGKNVEIGDKSECQHCHFKFTLIQKGEYPTWTPDWQIENAKKEKEGDKCS